MAFLEKTSQVVRLTEMSKLAIWENQIRLFPSQQAQRKGALILFFNCVVQDCFI